MRGVGMMNWRGLRKIQQCYSNNGLQELRKTGKTLFQDN
jgi:hypothetical protein